MSKSRPTDQWGYPVTAAGADAAGALDATVMSYLAIGRETGALLKNTLSADPDMVMGHCLKGYFFLLMASGPLQARVPKVLAAAEAGLGNATAREKTYVRALKDWLGGDSRAAVGAWEEILADHPHDLLALRLAHHAYFYLGAAGDMGASVERVLGHWGADVPGYEFVLGMRAFALEEAGEYGAAEDAGRHAVDINPVNPWAVHAVAHVMEMQDRHDEGIQWIGGLEGHWKQANNFRYHIEWHRALMHLDRGETAAVLELYDTALWDAESDEYLDICNDVALLIRLEILGLDVGPRWRALAGKVAGRMGEHLHPFIDCHFMAALVADGRDADARAMLDGMKGRGGLFADVAAPVCEAIIQHQVGDYARAAERMAAIRPRIAEIGGSHAQRDLFELVLIDAAIKSGDLAQAQALLAERTAAKPGNGWSWRAYTGVLKDMGEDSAAAEAAARAAALGGA